MSLSLRKPLLVLVALMLLVAAVAVPVTKAVAADVVVPVSGELKGKTKGTFEGNIVNPNVTYSKQGNTLLVSGTLQGTVTKADGTAQAVDQAFSDVKATAYTDDTTPTGAAAAQATQSCQILNLDLGPLHLDLPGLVVDLSAIQLDVTAVPGAGNLLGNLLCAVAGLLDPNTFLADFLNELLANLFG
jgi:hypothetical protein